MATISPTGKDVSLPELLRRLKLQEKNLCLMRKEMEKRKELWRAAIYEVDELESEAKLIRPLKETEASQSVQPSTPESNGNEENN
ncbi:unnamed protein product [Caenorhabditis auriculariae]|uniref:Uncharacterized protein n=1 Tax=Caenorhabditis auriculariae TaxID=2777116 RepID=A0A8S1HLY6_9PELO|nr:unnamed protein product [Caenorhabditis auriculariae]